MSWVEIMETIYKGARLCPLWSLPVPKLFVLEKERLCCYQSYDKLQEPEFCTWPTGICFIEGTTVSVVRKTDIDGPRIRYIDLEKQK